MYFLGRTPEKPLSNMVFLMTLRRMKVTDVTVHGFRSTFRDWAAERTNFPRAVCESRLVAYGPGIRPKPRITEPIFSIDDVS